MTTTDAFTDELLADEPTGGDTEPWRRDGLRCVRATIDHIAGDVAVCRLDGGGEALMAVSEYPPQLSWAAGDEIVALWSREERGAWLSCNRPELVALTAEGIVPELRDGTVRIMGLARSPGVRTKLAVAPTVEGLDPVTAVVGRGASRVRAITRQLRGERLDVVAWHPDRATYLRNAFAPASVDQAVATSSRQWTVSVPRHQMAAAVGEQGLNASLAGQLVGVTVTVMPS